ncbi:MAG: protoheme IX farnesyltransferase [Bacteroidetes bacterium]|nr:protoheme IX farnesyltransferase [Bacteroidota bacterium]
MQTSGLRVIFVLTRFPVSLAVTFTAFAALVLSPVHLSLSSLIPVAGIFLLASGASAFNQYQEWPYDERMERTKKRPIPSRRITTAEALRYAMMFIIGGMLILLYYAPPVCFILGFINLMWYNGIYTYLKRKTAFAVVPGALTGAIPIFMGWTAGGGSLLAPEVLFLAFFLFIWQMPHFWMLTLKYGHEYRNAGFPVLTDFFSEFQIKTIVMGWMIASSGASIMLVYFKILHLPAFGFTIIGLNIVLLLLMAYQLFFASIMRYRLIFISANLFMMIVMLSLIADRFIIG